MSRIQIRGWSKEEYFLRHDKYSLNMYSSNYGDLPGSSSDNDVHYKRIRMMGIQKYLKKSCYHRIEYTAATFLLAFMLRLLNSAILATTTHRKPERVSDGTDTQVKAQMINKCRIKMAQRKLYNVRNPL